jgi:ribosomal protein S18 acetylase RimI-like enzyme
MFCIKTKARGIGIGKALVEYLARFHPEIKTLEVYPYKKANEDALAFYKKIGFSQDDIELFADYHNMPSTELYIHMKKEINR